MKSLITACALLALAACTADPSNHNMVVLQNAKTGDTKECKGDAWTTWNVPAQVEACAKAYEKAGYKRMGAY